MSKKRGHSYDVEVVKCFKKTKGSMESPSGVQQNNNSAPERDLEMDGPGDKQPGRQREALIVGRNRVVEEKATV